MRDGTKGGNDGCIGHTQFFKLACSPKPTPTPTVHPSPSPSPLPTCFFIAWNLSSSLYARESSVQVCLGSNVLSLSSLGPVQAAVNSPQGHLYINLTQPVPKHENFTKNATSCVKECPLLNCGTFTYNFSLPSSVP